MPTGTYAAVRYSKEASKKLEAFLKDIGLPNPVASTKFHTTILYSRRHCKDLPQKTVKYNEPVSVEVKGFDTWDTRNERGEPSTKALVLELESPALVMLHEVLMELHDASYDFEKFKAHITLSYDIADFQTSVLKDRLKEVDFLAFDQFYVEDLDVSWSETKATSK